jgi:hypothetical protein
MFDFMKCIKTGCDVICDNMIFHGDLFYYNNTLILSGVPNESWSSYSNNVNILKADNKKIYYHFQCKKLHEIPPANIYTCFLVEGVFDVQSDFLNQIKKYENQNCIDFFEKTT